MKDGTSSIDKRDYLSSKRWVFTLWQEEELTNSSVVGFLKQKLPHLLENSWEERLLLGGIYLNGRRILMDQTITLPCKIEYFEPRYEISEIENEFPQINQNNILYREDGIVAFFKPAGLPSLPAKDQIKFNFRSQAQKILGNQTPIHMPSRLDTSVSGLILLSEDPRLHGSIQKLFEKKQISKRYLALVSPSPCWRKIEINLPIGRDLTWGVLRRIDKEFGKPSYTKAFNLKAYTPSSSLLSLYPLTGRTHQLRLHLSAIGCPIIGDKFYGGVTEENLCLLSYSIRFRHPATGRIIKIKVPYEMLPKWSKQAAAKESL